jgi:hypothetical protein
VSITHQKNNILSKREPIKKEMEYYLFSGCVASLVGRETAIRVLTLNQVYIYSYMDVINRQFISKFHCSRARTPHIL